jgi:hypothetical protein
MNRVLTEPSFPCRARSRLRKVLREKSVLATFLEEPISNGAKRLRLLVLLGSKDTELIGILCGDQHAIDQLPLRLPC